MTTSRSILPRSALHGVLAVLTVGWFAAATRASEVDAPVGADLSAWRADDVRDSSWEIVDAVALDPADPKELRAGPGTGVLWNRKPGGAHRNIHTAREYGDVEVHVEFLVPAGSNSGVYLMGRYEIQILDSWDSALSRPRPDPGHGDCGGIYQRWDPSRGAGKEGYEGHGPRVNACRAPGEWQSFDILFRAPRFDAAGKRTEAARFVKVFHNGVVVHENVDLSGPTRAATWEDEAGEKPVGPLMLQGDHGPVAYRGIRIRPVEDAARAEIIPREAFDDTGLVAIFDGKTLDGWHVSAKTGHSGASGHKTGGRWVVEDGAIVGSQDIPGNGGIIITDRQFRDFEVVLEMRNDFGPDSGLFLRSTEDGRAYQYLVDYHSGGSVAGLYGEGINPGFHVATYAFLDSPSRIEAKKSEFGLPVSPAQWPKFWKHGEWNELRARIVGDPPTITTWINGVRFMEWTDPRKRHPEGGGIALQVHGGGDLTKQFVRYRNIRVREFR